MTAGIFRLEMPATHGTREGELFAWYMDEVSALSAAGKLKTRSIVSHRMGLSEAAEAYRQFEAREATKIVLDPRS